MPGSAYAWRDVGQLAWLGPPSAMSPATELAGTPLCTANTCGPTPMRVIGTKSVKDRSPDLRRDAD